MELKIKPHAKIHPTTTNESNATNLELVEITEWIGQQYVNAKENKLVKFLLKLKSMLFAGSAGVCNPDPYLDPEFIVIESLKPNQIAQLIEMFIDEKKTTWAYNDIAKYIRKHWTENKIESYVNEIIGYLIDLPNLEKYWFFEFLPLLGEPGKSQILFLVLNENLQGKSSELLYGIYLMEPENLWDFYPKFLLAVEQSGSFELWEEYFENFKIIDKLYANGYNIFNNDQLIEFWTNPANAHSKKLMENKLKLIY